MHFLALHSRFMTLYNTGIFAYPNQICHKIWSPLQWFTSDSDEELGGGLKFSDNAINF